MATWITHLRIAENLLRLAPDLQQASFFVGSIAPDSGIPDAKWEKFDPPSDVTHFGNLPGADHKLADLVFYQRHLLPLRGGHAQELVSFRMGYFFHLVTDNLWSTRIGLPTHERFTAEFAATGILFGRSKKIGTVSTSFTYTPTLNACSGTFSWVHRRKMATWIFCLWKLCASGWNTSKSTISVLVQNSKMRIIVLISTFIEQEWTSSWMKPVQSFSVYINAYG